MSATTTRLQSQRAPCGRLVDGEHFQDQDEDGLITDNWHYACGCRSTHHEYHDGSVERRIVRHDGRVLQDELFAEN